MPVSVRCMSGSESSACQTCTVLVYNFDIGGTLHKRTGCTP